MGGAGTETLQMFGCATLLLCSCDCCGGDGLSVCAGSVRAAPLLFSGKHCLQVSRPGSEELIPVKHILLALVVAGPP